MPLHGRHRHVRPHLDSAVALLFAAGSTLFMLGGILSLVPALAAQLALSPAGVNAVYFAGSVPFTTAAGLQLAQAASAQAAQREAGAGKCRGWAGTRGYRLARLRPAVCRYCIVQPQYLRRDVAGHRPATAGPGRGRRI